MQPLRTQKHPLEVSFAVQRGEDLNSTAQVWYLKLDCLNSWFEGKFATYRAFLIWKAFSRMLDIKDASWKSIFETS